MPERIVTVLCVPSIIRPLNTCDSPICNKKKPSLVKLLNSFYVAGTNECFDLSLSWHASEDPLKKPYRI